MVTKGLVEKVKIKIDDISAIIQSHEIVLSSIKSLRENIFEELSRECDERQKVTMYGCDKSVYRCKRLSDQDAHCISGWCPLINK